MPAASHAPLRIVQSRHNARVRQLRAALERPSADAIGLEGLHLVEEALRSGVSIRTIFVRVGSEALLDSLFARSLSPDPRLHVRRSSSGAAYPEPPNQAQWQTSLDAIELLAVPAEVLQSAVSTETAQPIAALAVPPSFSLEDLFPLSEQGPQLDHQPAPPPLPRLASLLLVLAGLQDPGNVGTILRSAEAFGATGILALPGTANPWNPKCLRASMGSVFRLPVVGAAPDDLAALLRRHGLRTLAAVAPSHPGASRLDQVDLRIPSAIWIGNEGSGLAPGEIASCDRAVTIPCPGPVESLNAAIAASVMLYEASRQRTLPTQLPIGLPAASPAFR